MRAKNARKGPKCSLKNLQDLNAMQRRHADLQKLKTGSNMQFQKTMGFETMQSDLKCN